MTRKEYDLVFQAFKSYRVYMTDEQEVLSEKILDDLYQGDATNGTYPEFDKLSSENDVFDEIVADAEEVLSEKILDDLFYPEFDKLSTDDLVADAEEALANEPEINGVKSLNFR